MFEIDTRDIAIPRWTTPMHKIHRAFNDGRQHAINHYTNEPLDPDRPFGVNSWAVSPYSETRPDAHWSWVAGFCAEWGELNRDDAE